jgi:EAL domain-containing protein (putative c-di-GMP-specific phosphodiesterase class I)
MRYVNHFVTLPAQIDLSSGAVIGAEALIRWQHPEFGLLPPGKFITLAEESGLIVPIGEWALREACRQAMAWRKQGLPDLVMAVTFLLSNFGVVTWKKRLFLH